QVVVVDDDARTLPGPALTKVEVLALAVTLRVLLGLPAEAMVPVPLDPDKDREVPAAAQLRPMEEDAVEEQDRSGGRPLLGRLDGRGGGPVRARPPTAPPPAGAGGVGQPALEHRVVVGRGVDPPGGGPPPPVTDRSRMVERVDAGADEWAPYGSQRARELV